ncbi:thioredoxin family protein [Polaribacter sp.]|nr:thioredoxin family protein [Polaribacter sp.]
MSNFNERIINYQNNSERNYNEKKSIANIFHYIIAFIIFFSSTLISVFSFPFRFVYKNFNTNKKNSKILKANTENIDELIKKEKIVLLDFWAEWFGPCLMMHPILEKFSEESKHITIVKVNADLNRKLLSRFQIKGLPQFVLIKNKTEIKRHAGPMTVSELKRFCSTES